MLHVDKPAFIEDTTEELTTRIEAWKTHLSNNSLRFNMKKTKVMCCGKDLDVLQDTGRQPCGVCRQGVGSNSIYTVPAVHTGSISPAVEPRVG